MEIILGILGALFIWGGIKSLFSGNLYGGAVIGMMGGFLMMMATGGAPSPLASSSSKVVPSTHPVEVFQSKTMGTVIKRANLRTAPLTTSSVIGVLGKGDVQILGTASNGRWYKVKAVGQEGYVYADLIKPW